MSCPDWSRVPAVTDQESLDLELRRHADGCAPCREQALRRDPTLVFRHLPSPTVTAADIESMQQAVAAMRRGNRIGRPDAASEKVAPTRRGRTWSAQLRAAVLAVALAGAGAGLLMPWEREVPVSVEPGPVESGIAESGIVAAEPLSTQSPVAVGANEAFDRGPLIENVEDFDEVIQMAHDDHDLVFVFVDREMETSNLDV